MSNRRFTEEFKSEAVKQVTGRGYKVREVSKRLGVFGVSTKSMYVWLKQARSGNGRRGKGAIMMPIHKRILSLFISAPKEIFLPK